MSRIEGTAPAPRLTSRRQLIAGALGTGFALAVQPVTAATITTDSQGLEAGPVSIPTTAGKIPAYRAHPSAPGKSTKGGKFPTLLVVQEIFGVHEHIKDVCRRLAKLGYFAIAPDLYVRQGDVSKLAGIDRIRPIVDKVPDAQVLLDLDATVAWSAATGKADTGRLGITGFCWGGRVVWLYAAHSKVLKAGVAWYGRLVGDTNHLHPRQPVDIAPALNAPALGLYGGQDKGIPLETVEQMKRALAGGTSAAKKSHFQVYPAAGHAFFADYRANYEPASAADGYKRMLAWFKASGVG